MLYVVKWTRPGESIYTDCFMARNENDARDKWGKLHISMSNSAYVIDIQCGETNNKEDLNLDD